MQVYPNTPASSDQRDRLISTRQANVGAANAVLKYSNWLVTAILLFIGVRILLVILKAFLSADGFWKQRPVASLVQATVAVLFVAAAAGTVRWKSWGRSLGIVICAWNAFATMFLVQLGKHRALGLSFFAVLVLLVFWFCLPKVKGQFASPID